MIFGGFGLVRRDILGAKEQPKLLQKLTKKMIDFWIAPKTALEGLWGSKRGPRGGGPKFALYAGGGSLFITEKGNLGKQINLDNKKENAQSRRRAERGGGQYGL